MSKCEHPGHMVLRDETNHVYVCLTCDLREAGLSTDELAALKMGCAAQEAASREKRRWQ